jgi:hypothetical protein
VYTVPWDMNEDYMRISEQVLGRPPGAHPPDGRDAPAAPRGRQRARRPVYVGGPTFHAYTGQVWIELLELDDDGEPISGIECGVASLEGWEIL